MPTAVLTFAYHSNRKFGIEGLSNVASANLSASIVSALQGGGFFGALFAWPLSDRIGRKTTVQIVPIIAGLGVAMQAASSGYLAIMYIGRCLCPFHFCYQSLIHSQSLCWPRRRNCIGSSTTLRFREFTASHSWSTHRSIPAFHCFGHHDQLLDRLWLIITHPRKRCVDCST